MLFKKIFIIIIITVFSLNAFANTPRSTGKYKNWESFVAETEKVKFVLLKLCQLKERQQQLKEINQNYL